MSRYDVITMVVTRRSFAAKDGSFIRQVKRGKVDNASDNRFHLPDKDIRNEKTAKDILHHYFIIYCRYTLVRILFVFHFKTYSFEIYVDEVIYQLYLEGIYLKFIFGHFLWL